MSTSVTSPHPSKLPIMLAKLGICAGLTVLGMILDDEVPPVVNLSADALRMESEFHSVLGQSRQSVDPQLHEQSGITQKEASSSTKLSKYLASQTYLPQAKQEDSSHLSCQKHVESKKKPKYGCSSCISHSIDAGSKLATQVSNLFSVRKLVEGVAGLAQKMGELSLGAGDKPRKVVEKR
jgi:hypothetical protein